MMVDPKLQNKINYFYASYNTDVVFGKQMSFRKEPEKENGEWTLKWSQLLYCHSKIVRVHIINNKVIFS